MTRAIYSTVILAILGIMASAQPVRATSNVCAMPDGFTETGIGGTGLKSNGGDDDKGIGGTGHRAENGIGGTGDKLAQAKSVFVTGTIYAHGSICVNGLRITYDNRTPTTDNGQNATTHDLKLGQVVRVWAEKIPGKPDLAARRISIERAIEGPITQILPGNRGIKVMDRTISVANPAAVKQLSIGQNVRISGLATPDQKIVATIIEKNPNQKSVSVSGIISKDQAGNLSIGGTPITLKSVTPLSNETVHVSGKWADGRLAVEKISKDNAQNFTNADAVSIEGYVAKRTDTGSVRINNRTVSDSGKLRVGERVIIVGTPDSDGNIRLNKSRDVRFGIHTRSEIKQSSNDLKINQSPSPKNESNSDSNGGDHHGTEGHDSGHDSDHGDSGERLDKTEKVESVEKIEVEKVEVEKVEVEKPEKIEVEKPEKIEVEKPEKIEVEKPEKIEKPEIEHGD